MALTDWYIDTTGGSDSTGTGSSGAPWKSIAHLLATVTQSAGGDRVNYINSIADDVLSASLSLATYGTPSTLKPLVIQGNGIVGGINGNAGGFQILSNTAQCIAFQNMHLHNCGASPILTLNSGFGAIINCEIDGSTAGTAITCGELSFCNLHGLTGSIGASVSNASYNTLNGLSGTPSLKWLSLQGKRAFANRVLLATGACVGISLDSAGSIAEHNSVWSNAGTGTGIVGTTAFDSIINNIVEGFSGTGGKGFDWNSICYLLNAGNRCFNCATPFPTSVSIFASGNVTDTASNFNNPSTGDLSLVTGSPAKAAAWPGTYPGSPTQTSYRDAGALQSAASGGGGGGLLLNSGMTGGMRG